MVVYGKQPANDELNYPWATIVLTSNLTHSISHVVYHALKLELSFSLFEAGFTEIISVTNPTYFSANEMNIIWKNTVPF